MKRKILIAVYVILICITLKLIYNTTSNNILIRKYNNGEYAKGQAKALTYINFPQKYVANYNYGNILYQNGEYESAIEEYKKALSGAVPKYKECNIRINYALAICKTVQVNESNQESIRNAINIYESAIGVLTEDGCANKKDSNGHSQKAEQLKRDIQNEIDRLKQLQKQENSNSDNNKQEQEEKNDNNTETIEEKIQTIKEDATKEQRENEKQYENYRKGFDKPEKNW